MSGVSHNDPDPPARRSNRPRRPADVLTNPENGDLAEALVDRIEALARLFPTSVPKATRDDYIYHVIHRVEGEDKNAPRRLKFVRRGPNGMALVVKYFREIQWGDLQPPLVTIKLERIIAELEFLSANAPPASRGSSPASRKKRKSEDVFSDVEEVSPPKRIRSTAKGSVTVEDVDETDDFAPQDSGSDESDADGSGSDEAGPSKPVLGPGGKANRVTKQDVAIINAKNRLLLVCNTGTIPGQFYGLRAEEA
ncbi:hypothetical protein B0H13DRAFT_2358558 [Mycena leptocephala]|nr:hypothetical protein B0H13DRAFT_2358558 [Mycena leptocephala]